MSETENNKRIAKNTLLLYFRMVIVTVVALFTTRIILNLLGVKDFGIYNVVAGVVGFIGVLNGAMISASQRFLAFEIGRGDTKDFNKLFGILLIIFIVIAITSLIIALLLGNWIINDFLVIPEERLGVSMYLYYFSIFTFVVNFISIPFISSIIAHEKMGIYAYMSFIEVILKLLLAYSLYISTFDKLLTYGFLTMIVTLIIALFYGFYCRFNLKAFKFSFSWDKKIVKQILRYTGWNLFGSLTAILNFQGQSLILNLFFGPIVNAAKAIADKINSVVVSFSNNFYMAVRPQIIKSYASGNRDYMFKLVYQSTKFSFYLLFVITMPFIFLMKKLLGLWLGKEHITDNMVVFSQLALVYSLVNVFEQPITVMIQATGKIRNYEIIIGSITLLLLPMCYIVFKMGYPAYYSFVLLIIIYMIAHVFRMFIARWQVGLSITYYCRNIFIPIFLSILPSCIISYLLIDFFSDTFISLILSGLLCFSISLFFIFIFGINKDEHALLTNQLKIRILKIRSKWKVRS